MRKLMLVVLAVAFIGVGVTYAEWEDYSDDNYSSESYEYGDDYDYNDSYDNTDYSDQFEYNNYDTSRIDYNRFSYDGVEFIPYHSGVNLLSFPGRRYYYYDQPAGLYFVFAGGRVYVIPYQVFYQYNYHRHFYRVPRYRFIYLSAGRFGYYDSFVRFNFYCSYYHRHPWSMRNHVYVTLNYRNFYRDRHRHHDRYYRFQKHAMRMHAESKRRTRDHFRLNSHRYNNNNRYNNHSNHNYTTPYNRRNNQQNLKRETFKYKSNNYKPRDYYRNNDNNNRRSIKKDVYNYKLNRNHERRDGNRSNSNYRDYERKPTVKSYSTKSHSREFKSNRSVNRSIKHYQSNSSSSHKSSNLKSRNKKRD